MANYEEFKKVPKTPDCLRGSEGRRSDAPKSNAFSRMNRTFHGRIEFGVETVCETAIKQKGNEKRIEKRVLFSNLNTESKRILHSNPNTESKKEFQ